ncbi:LytTR family DNA-binding domain-containing protein [Furfurilactobacillus rossiae]|uniref:HTH LytTR-type domain-containing protein n=1 Tax=Furfurilactobacillus rossiae DSM 15814 TaxID=1114972 RepID=A0A0R1RHF0_9LACO|nr:LytTR family DNA-binding domain-containing protein [Furfurilactobacillus rossiae]KRL55801.1 hypothetical protein FD35_GL002332 [Furfurilactobacillus rossiae DSM 15814]QLE60176.1 Response regulator of the LytR-AlgR [Furfurilactobacillus rossiae]
MKVHVEIDPECKEPEVIIRTATVNDEVKQLEQRLVGIHTNENALACFQGSTQYFVSLDDILFIETADRLLQVHTALDIFNNRQRLYELVDELPGFFLQVSKSTIINLHYVSALNKSLSSCLVSFAGSHKEVYASRRYTKQLQERLNEMRSLS